MVYEFALDRINLDLDFSSDFQRWHGIIVSPKCWNIAADFSHVTGTLTETRRELVKKR